MIINSPFLPASKSAGGLTFSKWKGLNTARARIFSNSSKSPKQIFQRDRFKFVSYIASLWGKEEIARFWRQYEKNTTYANEYQRFNVPLQPVYVDDSTPFDPDGASIRIMKGGLELADFNSPVTYDPVSGDTIISWASAISGNGLASDKVYILLLDGETIYSLVSDTAIRSDSTITLSMPTGSSGASMTAYIGTYRDLIDGTIMTSNSNAVDVSVI